MFAQRWLRRLPMPLTDHDEAAGYWWELSMRQVEVSRTIVFDAPRRARGFFEALIADNLDLGRPEHVEILFKRDPRGRKPKDQAGGTFRTAIDRVETLNPSRINIFQRLGYKFWKAATSPLTTPMPNNRWRLLTLVSRESITAAKVRLGVGYGFIIPVNRRRGGRLSEWFPTP